MPPNGDFMSNDPSVDFLTPIEAQGEDLDIEFKRTLPLKHPQGKAKLAKEICALANHGGGWIVLGREDDGTYPSQRPEELGEINQDTINQIASAYLQPAPHCSVKWVKPDDTDYEVLVIRVPQVGIAHICGLKNGPDDGKGNLVGIRKGVHYIRKAGPTSAPIESQDEWQSVIRRCVLSDKTALLGALSTMMNQPVATEEKGTNILDADIAHLTAKWREDAQKHSYEVDLLKNFVCYGFQFLEAEKTSIDNIKQALLRRSGDTLHNYSFFDNGYLGPNNQTRVIEVQDTDGLEVYKTSPDFDMRHAWRLSEALSGCEIVSYREDTKRIKDVVEGQSSLKWERGTKIWIDYQIYLANSFLAIVNHLADHIGYTRKVRIRVIFSGLKGRSLDSPDFRVDYSMNYIAHQDTKNIDFTIERSALSPEVRSSTIVSMIQPMNKLTQGPEVTPETVLRSLERLG